MDEEVQFIIDSTKEAMDKALTHLNKKFLNIRAGSISFFGICSYGGLLWYSNSTKSSL